MKQLWAPWRIEFIRNIRNKKTCFLCDAAQGKGRDLPIVICRRKTCFSMLNRFPYNNGHLLIAPLKHKSNLHRLTNEELLDIMRLIRDSERVLRRVLNPDGFNIGANIGAVAGAGIPGHLHFHIVPRWKGDTSYMPVIGDTKVIPQALDELAKELRQHFPSE